MLIFSDWRSPCKISRQLWMKTKRNYRRLSACKEIYHLWRWVQQLIAKFIGLVTILGVIVYRARSQILSALLRLPLSRLKRFKELGLKWMRIFRHSTTCVKMIGSPSRRCYSTNGSWQLSLKLGTIWRFMVYPPSPYIGIRVFETGHVANGTHSWWLYSTCFHDRGSGETLSRIAWINWIIT